jgi:tetratricopeptide (TPR) repeat protein
VWYLVTVGKPAPPASNRVSIGRDRRRYRSEVRSIYDMCSTVTGCLFMRTARWATVMAVAAVIGISGCGPKPEVARPPGPEAPPTEQTLTNEERLELAKVYMDKGRVGDAAEHYAAVLGEDPASFEANLNMGLALMTMEDAKFENQRDYTAIRQYFLRAKDIRGDDARPYVYLGTLDFKAGTHPKAIDPLSVAAELDPTNDRVHEMLGISLIKIGSGEAGRATLLRALTLNPNNEGANLELGTIYEKEDRNDLAIRHLERALEINPNLDMATYILQRAYYEESMYERAEAKCKEFLRFHPKDIQSLEILAWIYKRREQTRRMLDVYAQLTRIAPENTAYWAPIIQHHMAERTYARAREVLQVCLEHNPYYAYANIQYGQVLIHSGSDSLRSGNREDALSLFAQAKGHLERAKVDDRYTSAASQLIDRAQQGIRDASAR